jgi:5-hydroxyisourate hydrolase-like protein (transthyretin family)
LVLVAAAALAIPACRAKGPEPVRITGRTIGAKGEPLADVRVTLEISRGDTEEQMAAERVETRTDARGEFSISYQGQWRRASYRLEVRKTGYRNLSVEQAETLKNPVTLRLAPAS